MDNKDALRKNWIIDLIKDAGYCCFATTEDDQARVRPMMPHLADDGTLLLAVFVNCRTIPQIKKNPKVEMCYIDRKMSFCRISGRAQVSSDLSKKDIVWNNIPTLRQYFSGINDPNFILIEIETISIEIMTPMQKTPEVFTGKLVSE